MKLRYIFIQIVMMALFVSCKEEFNAPIDQGGAVPQQISQAKVENTPGGAIITYNVPNDPNFLYAQAEIESSPGVIRKFKASKYSDSLFIDGLADESVRTVSIYSVSKSEKRSEPLAVSIHPLTPAYLQILQSLKVTPTFGGARVDFVNKNKDDIAISFCANDPITGVFKKMDAYYTGLEKGSHIFRGLDAVENKVGVYIKDKWGHISDTLYVTLTPFFEKLLDKNLFRDKTLNGDSPLLSGSAIAKINLWDGKWGTDFDGAWYGDYRNCQTDGPVGAPQWVTFDLGITSKLSRYRINPYWRFESHALRKYEIWGSDNPPADGSWNNWHKMSYHEQIKPSGLPTGSFSAEDKQTWLQGDNVDLDQDVPPVRYIRIKCLENWRGTTTLTLAEITFWGS